MKEWLGITGLVGKPYNEHPKRPVLGFECTRSEVGAGRGRCGRAGRRGGGDLTGGEVGRDRAGEGFVGI